jgi:hypothetical protein
VLLEKSDLVNGFAGAGCAAEGFVVTTTVSVPEGEDTDDDEPDDGLGVVGVAVGEGTPEDSPRSVLDELVDGVADVGEAVAGVAGVVATAGVATGVGLAGGALEGVTSTMEEDAEAAELLEGGVED